MATRTANSCPKVAGLGCALLFQSGLSCAQGRCGAVSYLELVEDVGAVEVLAFISLRFLGVPHVLYLYANHGIL